MKPKILEDRIFAAHNVKKDNLVSFNNTTGTELKDSNISIEEVLKLVQMTNALVDHMANDTGHVSPEDRERWNKREAVSEHMTNDAIHVSAADREFWNEKESVAGAQAKADAVMTQVNKHVYDSGVHVTAYDKQKLNNTYSKEEIEALISTLQTNTQWKEAVNSYEDLYTTYPDPIDGWTVNILDSDLTYKWDGEEWIAISANFIPLATQEVDGKMSKYDKKKLDNIEEGANKYVHPTDEFTRHVTDNQIAQWSAKADNVLADYTTDGLLTKEDKVKLDNIEENANFYEHPSTHSARIIEQTEDLTFISTEERNYWNAKADNKRATIFVDGVMSNTDKKKLDNIADGANLYTHPARHNPDVIEENTDKQFVSAQDKTVWNGKFGRGDFLRGSAILNGTAGTKIVHSLNDTTNSYSVIITLTSAVTPDRIGQIFVVKDPNAIFVYSTGGNITDSFDYLIIQK
jgi:hypothetical protein